MIKPFLVRLAGGYYIINKSHTANTIFNTRKIEPFLLRLFTIDPGAQRQGKIAVQISKCFKVTFRVTTRRTGIMCLVA